MASMDLHLIVLVKQVPDTKNITADAMKEDGTVNRSALPAIFNPEDLNALELALWVRDCYGGKVTVMTMGPPTAASGAMCPMQGPRLAPLNLPSVSMATLSRP